MNQDIQILRQLTQQYVELIHTEEQRNVWQLHADLNDLHPQRPIVLIEELPWHELNFDGFLTLRCQDKDFREIEDFLRKKIFHYRYFPGDMIVQPYLSVPKIIHSTGIGVEVKEETLSLDKNNAVVAHKYENQFSDISDPEKLHNPVITYKREESLQRFWKICEAVGDLIPVKLTGADTGYNLGHIAWDTIATFMSVEDLLYHLVDEPEMMHAFVSKLTDIFLDTIRQYEELNLLNPDSPDVHCSSTASRELMNAPVDLEHVKASNVWGRGLAQILASVSPQMHDEFEIQYASKAMEPFGLVYYGCCEPLDNKIDIVKKIPHLRKISITPWADINIAAEAVGKDYVISAKPNPANLPLASSQPDVIRKELRTLLNACRKNGTPCELLLKDISTSGYCLENLIAWNRIAKEEIENL